MSSTIPTWKPLSHLISGGKDLRYVIATSNLKIMVVFVEMGCFISMCQILCTEHGALKTRQGVDSMFQINACGEMPVS